MIHIAIYPFAPDTRTLQGRSTAGIVEVETSSIPLALCLVTMEDAIDAEPSAFTVISSRAVAPSIFEASIRAKYDEKPCSVTLQRHETMPRRSGTELLSESSWQGKTRQSPECPPGWSNLGRHQTVGHPVTVLTHAPVCWNCRRHLFVLPDQRFHLIPRFWVQGSPASIYQRSQVLRNSNSWIMKSNHLKGSGVVPS